MVSFWRRRDGVAAGAVRGREVSVDVDEDHHARAGSQPRAAPRRDQRLQLVAFDLPTQTGYDSTGVEQVVLQAVLRPDRQRLELLIDPNPTVVDFTFPSTVTIQVEPVFLHPTGQVQNGSTLRSVGVAVLLAGALAHGVTDGSANAGPEADAPSDMHGQKGQRHLDPVGCGVQLPPRTDGRSS